MRALLTAAAAAVVFILIGLSEDLQSLLAFGLLAFVLTVVASIPLVRRACLPSDPDRPT